LRFLGAIYFFDFLAGLFGFLLILLKIWRFTAVLLWICYEVIVKFYVVIMGDFLRVKLPFPAKSKRLRLIILIFILFYKKYFLKKINKC